MVSSEQLLDKNFEITSRLFDIIGQNVIKHNYRYSWRTILLSLMILFCLTESTILLWAERTNLLEFLVILPTVLFTLQGLHKWLLCFRHHAEFGALRSKLVEILKLIKENRNNEPVIAKVLRLSPLIQKCVVPMYIGAGIGIVLLPFILWLTLGKKALVFVFFIPNVDSTTDEGFLMHLVLHAFLIVGAFCGYTANECMFLSLIVPVAAYVDALEMEIKEVNSMLKQPERDISAIRKQLERIVRLHQLIDEYKDMLEHLYSFLIMNKIGLIFLGIIGSIVVIIKANSAMPMILFGLQFQQLTQFCLMGTIITVKNEQLLDHIYNINWYELPKSEAKIVLLMLHKAQNPSNITIGKFKPLNVESYMDILKSIYSYVMILVTLIE